MTQKTRTLLPGQEFLINAGLLHSGNSWLLEMPTGSGKTWLANQAIEVALEQGHNAVYIAPIKALTQAQFQKWQNSGYSVGILDSDHELKPDAIAETRLLISTSESLESCLRHPQKYLDWIRKVSLVVIDEIDLIQDGWRGARLEGLLIELQLLNPLLRLIGITATLGDESDLRDWLCSAFVRTKKRAVPLEWQKIRFWTGAEKQERACSYLIQAVAKGHQCLVFCQSRGGTERLAKALQNYGIQAACHHAGLSPHERADAEEWFSNGKLQVLCATATLAAGVNLPAREVVIYDTQRGGQGGVFTPLPKRELIQMAGRAGRPGLDDQGTVTLLVHEREARTWETIHRAVLEPVRSALADPGLLSERILAAVEGGYVQTRVQIERFTQRTLAYQQGILPDVDQLLSQIVAAGLLTRAGTKYQSTYLGRIAAKHYLQPQSVLRLQKALRWQGLRGLDLLLVVCSCPDFLTFSVREEQLDQAERILLDTGGVLLASVETLQQHLKLDVETLVRVVWSACVLDHYAEGGGNATATAVGLSVSAQDLLKAVSSAQRILEALQELCTLFEFEDQDSLTPERLETLQKRLQYGFSHRFVALLSVPGLTPEKAKQLVAHGIGSVSALAKADPKTIQLVPGFGVKTSRRAVRLAQTIEPQLLIEDDNTSLQQQGVKTLKRLWLQTNWKKK